MSSAFYADLAWLPKAPADFATRCATALDDPALSGGRIQHLASHALDENQLHRVYELMRRAQSQGPALLPLKPLTLGILSNATTRFITPAIAASAARYGIALTCVEGDYDQVLRQATDRTSRLHAARPDAILIALDHRGLPAAVEDALSYLEAIQAGVRDAGAVPIVQNFAAPVERVFGSLDRVVHGTARRTLDAINAALASSIANTTSVLLDIAGLVETVGAANWHAPSLWNLGRVPFASTFLPLYGDHVARTVAALTGARKRCLILDLDNTLWGGVVGEEGLPGIVLGQGDPLGEAYLDVQRYALALRASGVVLAVCSKNDEEQACLPFRNHPEMMLREQHIAVFQANWSDKVSNIRAIAKELSLGLDAMVLLDDNPAERGVVREFLPEVGVPELPADPALFARALSAAGYFESTAYSAEDAARADWYQQQAPRASPQTSSMSIDAYLASLGMSIAFEPFDATGRRRIAQLINKSNQFNLTGRRYTEAQVAAIESDDSCFTLQIRLSDAFGDNGMIAVVVCRSEVPHTWRLDTWLMSCRVFGRRVEHATLREIVANARERGIRSIVGEYRPTSRNHLVRDLFHELGFTHAGMHDDGSTSWRLDVATASIPAVPIRVTRTCLPQAALLD